MNNSYQICLNDLKGSEINDFCKLMNMFRDEYFKGKSPFRLTKEHYLNAKQDGVLSILLYKHHTPIACAEVTIGNNYGTPALSVSTIFILNRYRGQGLSVSLYDYIEGLAIDLNAEYCIQIEESHLLKDLQKFLNLGYTNYDIIHDWTFDRQYKEKTYLLFKQQYNKRYRFLDKLSSNI